MFLSKNSLLTGLKIISVLFVCFMMFVFLRMLFVNEKSVLNRTSVNKDEIKEIDDKEVHIEKIEAKNLNEVEDNENCVGRYMVYYFYALVLGAFINVKKLCKMGPI